MATPPKPPPKKPSKPKMPKVPTTPPPSTAAPAPTAAAAARHTKAFAIKPWTGEGEGRKVLLYGQSGMGKTTLASMAPTPVFIGLDDGGRTVRNPITNEAVNAVDGIETFDDMRDALASKGLFDSHESIVIDTITRLEELSLPSIFRDVKVDGNTAKSIESYGWGKGWQHVLEYLRLVFSDCEPLIRKGKNIIFIGQEAAVTIANPEGLDFIQAGPKLHHDNRFSSRLEAQEWHDYVLRIGFCDQVVIGGAKKTVGKVVNDDGKRAVFTSNGGWYYAKARPLQDGSSLPPVIGFDLEDQPDALWQFIFPS